MSDNIRAVIIAGILAALVGVLAYIYHHIEENSRRSQVNELSLEYTRKEVEDHEERIRIMEKGN